LIDYSTTCTNLRWSSIYKLAHFGSTIVSSLISQFLSSTNIDMANARLLTLSFILLFHAAISITTTTPSSYSHDGAINIKSLSTTVTARQFRFSNQFTSFRSFNRRSRARRRLRTQCLGGAQSQFRTYSGFCNNFRRPNQGAAHTKFIVLSPVPIDPPNRPRRGFFFGRRNRRRRLRRGRRQFKEYFARNSLLTHAKQTPHERIGHLLRTVYGPHDH